MKKTLSIAVAAALAAGAAACNESPTGPNTDAELAAAFNSVLLGYHNTASSFAGGPDGGMMAWGPGPRGGRGGHHEGGPGMGAMMGGGLGGLYLGGGFGPGFGHGRFGHAGLDDECAYDAAAARVICETETRDGLTIERSFSFRDVAGSPQTAFDRLTTDAINARVLVSGTLTRRNGIESTVEHASDRTVTGLAAGSTQRTVNGTSVGTETTKGTNDQGDFTAVRVMGDTTSNVVVPVPTAAGTAAYPVSGTVVRSMQVTLTYAGQAPSTSARREVVTYDGSDTAKLVITHDGVTKTCTLPLPRGRPTCDS